MAHFAKGGRAEGPGDFASNRDIHKKRQGGKVREKQFLAFDSLLDSKRLFYEVIFVNFCISLLFVDRILV